MLADSLLCFSTDEADKMFSPVSYEVAGTVSQYNTLFCSEYKVRCFILPLPPHD